MIRQADQSDIELRVFKTNAEFQRIMSQGVRRAQEEARAAGVPCVYSINGILHWELPDGSLTTEDPWARRDAADDDAANDA